LIALSLFITQILKLAIMDNIEKFQEVVSQYISQKISDWYSFEHWLETREAALRGDRQALLKLWDIFGRNLRPKLVMTVKASDEDWTPSTSLFLSFRATATQVVTIWVLLHKDEVAFVQLQSQGGLPDDFDYERAFDKRVVMLNALV
jgi:hypothetical protein